MTELPAKIYYFIGFLIVANLGAIFSAIILALKTVWWASKLESKVDETRAMTVRLHKRVDNLEGMN